MDNDFWGKIISYDKLFGIRNMPHLMIQGIPDVHDFIVCYQKGSNFSRNLLPRTAKQNDLYKYDSNDGMGQWRPDNLSVKTYSSNYDYPIKKPHYRYGIFFRQKKVEHGCLIKNRL